MIALVGRKAAMILVAGSSVAALTLGASAWFGTTPLRTPAPDPVAAAVAQAQPSGGKAGGTGNNGASDSKTFAIAGSVAGLYPGSVRQITLTLSNPNSFAINVTDLSVGVAPDGGPAGCDAALHLVGSAWSGSVVVAKKATASVSTALTVTMKSSAPNECEDALFPLTFAGKAVKA